MLRVFYQYQKKLLKDNSKLLIIYCFFTLSILFSYHLIEPNINLIEFGLGVINLPFNLDILLIAQKSFYTLYLLYYTFLNSIYIFNINKAYLFFRVSKKSLSKSIFFSNIFNIVVFDFLTIILTSLITGFSSISFNPKLLISCFFLKISLTNLYLLTKEKPAFIIFLVPILIIYLFYQASIILSLVIIIITYFIFINFIDIYDC